jgi:hypothetical protein
MKWIRFLHVSIFGEALNVYCAVTFRYSVVSDPNGSGFVILLTPERNKKKLEVGESLFLKTAMYVGLTGKHLT